MTRTAIVTAAALAFAATLTAAPAEAQSIRTFVSTAGSDSNPCSITSPCRHFSAAVAATAAGGEVDALDPGAYGSFTISHAITIEGQGWSYVAPPAGGAAITINAGASDNINIRGVSLNGVGVSPANGIRFNIGASLTVENSVIRNFSGNGIVFEPNSSTLSQLFVSNTVASNNVEGIQILTSGSGTTTGVLDHVTMENNIGTGLDVETNTQAITITVSDSVIANSGATGIFAGSNAPGSVNMMVRNSTIANSAFNGLGVVGSGSILRVTRSTITGNATAWADISSGVVASYVDNNIDGNGSANSTPPNTTGYH
jgi:hypothetical protein